MAPSRNRPAASAFLRRRAAYPPTTPSPPTDLHPSPTYALLLQTASRRTSILLLSKKPIGRYGRRTRFGGVGSRLIAPAVEMGKGRASPPTIPPTSQSALGREFDTAPSSDTGSYSDPDTDLDVLLDAEINPDVKNASGREESDVEPDSGVGGVMRVIARFREEGPARPKQTDRTKELWGKETIFKPYLRWRKKRFRVKKESTIDAYWNRVSMYYHNVTGYAIKNEVLRDVRNWIPSLELDRSKKEKHAMYVQTLYAILHALWVDDTKPLPGALIKSASNKGSNKALCFKDVQLMKVRSISDPNKSTIIANVDLVHVKNKAKNGTPKKFTFRLEGLPALCIVLHFLGIAKGRSAFRYDFTSVQQIFDLVIPTERNVLKIKWKRELLNKPFFCGFNHAPDGGAHATRQGISLCEQIIREFHNSINTDKIAKQLSGKAAEEVLMLPTVDFEHRERATIAAMLFKPIKNDKTSVRFVRTFVQLFPLRETRRPKTTKRAAVEFVFKGYGAAASSKWRKTRDGSQKSTATHNGKTLKQEHNLSESGDVVEVGPQHLYPNVPPHPERKDVLKKHVQTHLQEAEYQGEFECPYPNCHSMLDNGMHFFRHSQDEHKVAH
ncbi:hypothetical protein CC78DRAFT_584247 [Lojkania enalia]|uniref:Uncharacterized protein n=1 Tax=Lojkania enalia TaxID=147567 RepID=A0A9P4K2I4_9PLEO|nr:hypothetical protein CC78DRAFT_584247 [Didymosphaeria enalia]